MKVLTAIFATAGVRQMLGVISQGDVMRALGKATQDT